MVFSDKLEEPEEEIDYSEIREAIEKSEKIEVLACSRVSVMNRLIHPLTAEFPSIDSRFVSVEEVEIDETKLAEISARAVDEIVKGTELKAVHYKVESQENTILDDVDELEDLLG